ncbi:MAG TPA: GAF domain-containing protein [Candidatus Limnocylindria bacterium]|nr:GAF domain-containing protein [Candidatus Limnocylindria bacterium]
MTGHPTLILVFFPCIGTWRLLLGQGRSTVLRALGHESREDAALRQAAAIAASATPISDPLQRILEAALPVLPADHLVLVHVSTDRTESLILAAAGTARVWRWMRAPLGRGIASRAVESGKAQLASEAVATEETSTGPFRSGVAVPVILHGSVFGVLATADERRVFTRRHVNLLRAFADHCATAIDSPR